MPKIEEISDVLDQKSVKGGKVKALQKKLSKIYPPGRYLNYEVNFPAGYPRLNLGNIDLLALSPSQLFTADYSIPLFRKRGEIKLADTGTGKTISIFNTVGNSLLNNEIITSPLGRKVKHQVLVVTRASLVADTAKDLSALYARDDKEIIAGWNRLFGLNLPEEKITRFNHRDHVMSYAQFQNMLLGRSNRGRRFWAGLELLGNANCNAAVKGIVPTAYRRTENGYVRGNMPHAVALDAIDRVIEFTIKAPEKGKSGSILNLRSYQALWAWANVTPNLIKRDPNPKKVVYYYQEEGPNPNAEKFEKVDEALYKKWQQDSWNGFAQVFIDAFKETFNGMPAYNKIATLLNLTLEDSGKRGQKKFSFIIKWKPRTNEADVQSLFQSIDKLELLKLRLQRKYAFIADVKNLTKTIEGDSGWKLVQKGSAISYKAITDGLEDDFNPCDNITVIFDEAHNLVKTEGLEGGEIADFDLIRTAMQESNITAYFYTATLTLYPMMAFVQALHPKVRTEKGKTPNLPFFDAYENITHYQKEDSIDLLSHYIQYFDFGKVDPEIEKFGAKVAFSAAGKENLKEQAAGLISCHPDISTQYQYFSRSEYGGAEERGHIIDGLASVEHTKYLLKNQDKPFQQFRRLINYYDPLNLGDIPPKYTFGSLQFDMPQFVENVILKENPHCWFAKKLLDLLRNRDEEESVGLLPGEKLSRITIATGIRDSHGVNLIAAILQSAGYQWIKIVPRKLSLEDKIEADVSWSKNLIPPPELRKIAVLKNVVNENFDATLKQKHGPSERRLREGSHRFVTYSTTLVGQDAMQIQTIPDLISHAIENDYRTPFRGETKKTLQSLPIVIASLQLEDTKKNWKKFLDSITDIVIYFWPGADNVITNKEQTKLSVVRKANAKWANRKDMFFFRRYLDTVIEPAEMDVQEIEVPKDDTGAEFMLTSDDDWKKFQQFLKYDSELDDEGKKELIQSLREITNKEGETNNEVGIVVLGNKFDSGVDVYGSTALISTEPYADWTSEVQKNGRNNRRGGMAGFRYERWVRHQYAFALKWNPAIVRENLPKSRKDEEVLEPTLQSMKVYEIPEIESLKSETKKASQATKKALQAYSSAVVTSILRNPITDRLPNERILGPEEILEPYQIARIKAIKHPLVEVLNLIGGLAMRSAAFDLPFIEPVIPRDICAGTMSTGFGEVPSCVPTKYQLSSFKLARYIERNGLTDGELITFRHLYTTSIEKPEFVDIMRSRTNDLYITINQSSIRLPPVAFNIGHSRNLLLRLVQLRLATWHNYQSSLKKPKSAKKRTTSEKPKDSNPKKRKAVASNLLHYRIQPDYDIEKASQYTNAFALLSEGDLEQAAIHSFLHEATIRTARHFNKWNNDLHANTTGAEAIEYYTEKTLTGMIDLSQQREIQHAISVMQYYGMLNWNLAAVVLVGIATAVKDYENPDHLIDAALFGAHCYRFAPELVQLPRNWDLNFNEMTLRDASYCLDLFAGFEFTEQRNIPLSQNYAELEKRRDEMLNTIMDELYYNFYISISRNLKLLSEKMRFQSGPITTIAAIDVISKEELLFRSTVDTNIMKPALRSIVGTNKGLNYVNAIIQVCEGSPPPKYKIAFLFFPSNTTNYLSHIISTSSIEEFIKVIWPTLEQSDDENIKSILAYYKTPEILAENFLKWIAEPRKFPRNLEKLAKRLREKGTGTRLPFIYAEHVGKKIPKDQALRYQLQVPDDNTSNVLKIQGSQTTDTKQPLLDWIVGDVLVYSQSINPNWNFTGIEDELIQRLFSGVIEPKVVDLKMILEKRTFGIAKRFLQKIIVDSQLFDEESNLALQLRDRFTSYFSRTAKVREIQLDQVQNYIFDQVLRASVAKIEEFMDYVLQLMPKANPYWELFRLQNNLGESALPDLALPEFKTIYLKELSSRAISPDELNHDAVVMFMTKFEKIRLNNLPDDKIIEAMVSSKSKTNVPGVTIFVNAAKKILASLESELYALEGKQKEKQKRKPKVPKRAPIVDLTPESPTEEQSSKKQKSDVPEPVDFSSEEESDDNGSVELNEKLCSVCFLKNDLCDCTE